MYLGKVVELGTGDDIYRRPAHPYTDALIKTIPVPTPPPSAPRPTRASRASSPARSPRRPGAASGPAARARRTCARWRSPRCAGLGRRTRRRATSRSASPNGARRRRRGRRRSGHGGANRRRLTSRGRDPHRVEDERLDLGAVAEPGAPTRRSAMAPTPSSGRNSRREPGVSVARAWPPLGRLVDRHPRIVDGPGHEHRRPPARGGFSYGRVGPSCTWSWVSRGSPHSSSWLAVRGMEGSSIVVTTSTNGTSATTARQRSGRRVDGGLDQPARRRPSVTIRVPSTRSGPSLPASRSATATVVAERLRLGLQPAPLPPPPPAFAAAANVRDRVHHAPGPAARGGCGRTRARGRPHQRRGRTAGTARSISGVRAPGERHRDLGAVGRGAVRARCGNGPDQAGNLHPLEQPPGPGGQLGLVPGGGLHEGLLGDDHRAPVVFLGRARAGSCPRRSRRWISRTLRVVIADQEQPLPVAPAVRSSGAGTSQGRRRVSSPGRGGHRATTGPSRHGPEPRAVPAERDSLCVGVGDQEQLPCGHRDYLARDRAGTRRRGAAARRSPGSSSGSCSRSSRTSVVSRDSRR